MSNNNNLIESPLSEKDIKFISKYMETGSRIQALKYAQYPITLTTEAGERIEIEEYNPTNITNYYPNNTIEDITNKIKGAIQVKCNQIMAKKEIQHEIKLRVNRLRKESIADANEVMAYLTSVMRGEIKDQFGLEAPLTERTRAAIELCKRTFDLEHRNTENANPTINIHLDWSRDNTYQTLNMNQN